MLNHRIPPIKGLNSNSVNSSKTIPVKSGINIDRIVNAVNSSSSLRPEIPSKFDSLNNKVCAIRSNILKVRPFEIMEALPRQAKLSKFDSGISFEPLSKLSGIRAIKSQKTVNVEDNSFKTQLSKASYKRSFNRNVRYFGLRDYHKPLRHGLMSIVHVFTRSGFVPRSYNKFVKLLYKLRDPLVARRIDVPQLVAKWKFRLKRQK